MKQTAAAIEQLALTVAESAVKAKKLRDQVEALRVLAPFYTVLKKQRVHVPDAPDDKPSIGSMQDALRQIEGTNGRTVPHHRRRADTAPTSEV